MHQGTWNSFEVELKERESETLHANWLCFHLHPPKDDIQPKVLLNNLDLAF